MSALSRRLRDSTLLRCAFDRRATIRHRLRPIAIVTHSKSSEHPLLVESRS